MNETLLGFDFGPRKIGVAVGQTVTGSASPLTTLRAQKGRPYWNAIARLIAEWQPQALVVGMPYNMDDRLVDWAPQVQRFSRQLTGRFQLPVYTVDERLTSQTARQYLGRAARQHEVIDAVAAQLILETWLNERRESVAK